MNANEYELRRLATLDRAALAPLLTESRDTGHRHIERLFDDWESGANRFDQPGEALFSVFDGDAMIAIGGLNRDPYCADAGSARVRRVYVLAAYRRRGVGRMLMDAILAEAKRGFSRVTLRTSSAEAAAFYEAIGFRGSREFGRETTQVMYQKQS